MRRRHFEHAAAELEIDLLIRDNGDELLFARQLGGQWTNGVLANEAHVARILRINGNARVARNGLRPRRDDSQKRARLLGHFNLEMPK